MHSQRNFEATHMISLHMLKNTVDTSSFTSSSIARLANFGDDLPDRRVFAFMRKDPAKRPEPWLWEAHAIARVVGLNTILPLMGGASLESAAADVPEYIHADDLTLWRTGCMLPLGLALRITVLLKLRDPFDLQELLYLRAHNPRIEAAWAASEGGGYNPRLGDHTMHLLFGPRDLDPVAVMGLGNTPQPGDPTAKAVVAGRMAPGLRHWRETSTDLDAYAMAKVAGREYSAYTRYETCRAKLPVEVHERLAQTFPASFSREVYHIPYKPAPVRVDDDSAPPPTVDETVRSPDALVPPAPLGDMATVDALLAKLGAPGA